MFLGRYDFDGDRDELLAAYDRMSAGIPAEDIGIHVCVVRDGGITVYDTCPTADVFAHVSSDPDFLAQMKAVGLPEPVVTPLGPVHSARVAATLAS